MTIKITFLTRLFFSVVLFAPVTSEKHNNGDNEKSDDNKSHSFQWMVLVAQ